MTEAQFNKVIEKVEKLAAESYEPKVLLAILNIAEIRYHAHMEQQ